MPRPEAERLVARVRESVVQTTLAGIAGLRDELHPRYKLVAMTLRTPPLSYVPVTVAEAHASWHVTCRADSMMYHDALCTAARRLEMTVELHNRGNEAVRAVEALGVSVDDLERFLQIAGKQLGPPWHKEHRLAAAAAIGVLAERTRVTL
jgi:hypothetical protein